MEITRTQLIEHLGSLTVMEMTQLTRDLEETWGVSAAAPIPTAVGVGTDEPVEEQTEFDVIMESFGEKKIPVIKTLRAEMPGLGLKEAKELTESAPVTVKEAVSKEEAELLATKLKEVGATIKIV